VTEVAHPKIAEAKRGINPNRGKFALSEKTRGGGNGITEVLKESKRNNGWRRERVRTVPQSNTQGGRDRCTAGEGRHLKNKSAYFRRGSRGEGICVSRDVANARFCATNTLPYSHRGGGGGGQPSKKMTT